jgi:hypothetical protein
MQTKQEINGRIGENITEEILLRRFWVLKRTPDVDSTDFLIQIEAKSLEELRSRNEKIQVFGIAQSKYVSKGNSCYIDKVYVENNGVPRSEFFLFIHTDDIEGEPEHYFFTAHQIKENFIDTDRGYKFSITKDRTYDLFKNQKRFYILDLIEKGIRQTEAVRNFHFFNYINIKHKVKYLFEADIPIDSFSLKTIDILKDLKEEDLKLIKKFSQYVFSINDEFVFFKFDEYIGYSCGIGEYLLFDYEITDVFNSGDSTPKIKKIDDKKWVVLFSQGTIFNLILSSKEELYFYPISEGYGSLSHSPGNKEKNAIWHNMTYSSFWRKRNSRELHHRLSDEYNSGFLSKIISFQDMFRLDELGLMKNLPLVLTINDCYGSSRFTLKYTNKQLDILGNIRLSAYQISSEGQEIFKYIKQTYDGQFFKQISLYLQASGALELE